MRALIGALTMRGKAFLAAGCGAVIAGLAIGEADLLRVGVLLLMLPLLSALAASRARYRLSCTRQLVPRRVPVGQLLMSTRPVASATQAPSRMSPPESIAGYQPSLALRISTAACTRASTA